MSKRDKPWKEIEAMLDELEKRRKEEGLDIMDLSREHQYLVALLYMVRRTHKLEECLDEFGKAIEKMGHLMLAKVWALESVLARIAPLPKNYNEIYQRYLEKVESEIKTFELLLTTKAPEGKA